MLQLHLAHKDIINKPYLHVTDNAVMGSYLLRAIYENKVNHFIFTSCTVMYKNSSKYLSEKDVDEKNIPQLFWCGTY